MLPSEVGASMPTPCDRRSHNGATQSSKLQAYTTDAYTHQNFNQIRDINKYLVLYTNKIYMDAPEDYYVPLTQAVTSFRSGRGTLAKERRTRNPYSLSRTKSLIDAALRVWELKQRTR